MVIYVGLKIYCVSLYEMKCDFNIVSIMLHILIYVIICATYIPIINYFIYTVKLNIIYCENVLLSS